MMYRVNTEEFHTKDTEEEKITKREEGVFVRYLVLKSHAKLSYDNPCSPLP